MSIINFSNTRQMEGLFDAINPIKELIESKINLSRTADREKRINLNQNKVMRICFIVGLSLPTGEFYQFNLSSCIRQQNSLTAQFVSFSLSNLANIFYPPQFLQ